jgi:hypothetical protein
MATKVLTHFTSRPKSIEQRIEAGKALRLKQPIDQLGDYLPPAKRKDPVAILEKQAETRLKELVPIRYAPGC